MNCYRHHAQLLDVPEPATTTQKGAVFLMLPGEGDQAGDHEQEFVLFMQLLQAGGGGNPGAKVVVSTSADKGLWIEVASLSLVGDGVEKSLKVPHALGSFVMAATVLEGDPKPEHTAKVVLASNGPFRVRAVG